MNNSNNASPDDAASRAPYGRHIYFCGSVYCDPEDKAAGLYNLFAERPGELGRYDNFERVKRGIVPCLDVCPANRCLWSTPTASGITR